jgi:hypothetical protein
MQTGQDLHHLRVDYAPEIEEGEFCEPTTLVWAFAPRGIEPVLEYYDFDLRVVLNEHAR